MQPTKIRPTVIVHVLQLFQVIPQLLKLQTDKTYSAATVDRDNLYSPQWLWLMVHFLILTSSTDISLSSHAVATVILIKHVQTCTVDHMPAQIPTLSFSALWHTAWVLWAFCLQYLYSIDGVHCNGQHLVLVLLFLLQWYSIMYNSSFTVILLLVMFLHLVRLSVDLSHKSLLWPHNELLWTCKS